MITAEEFFRNKIKEQNPNREVVTLSQELITAEQGMLWAHEFKQLHLHSNIKSVCVSCDEETETHELCMNCIKKMIADNQQTLPNKV